jgi:hypothetical protein
MMTRLVRTGLRGEDRFQPCHLQIFENESKVLIEYLLLEKCEPPGIIEGVNSPSASGAQLIEGDQHFHEVMSSCPFTRMRIPWR